MKVVIVDNYDSFTHNLAHAVAVAGAQTIVVRNDACTLSELQDMQPDALVLSPGPGNPSNPDDFGVCTDIIASQWRIPILGVCLGMQGMVAHTGGEIVPAASIVHGEAESFQRGDHAIFSGLPKSIAVGRYHSLAVGPNLPPAWQPLGTADDGTLMAVAHQKLPWVGVQFHPESILTPDGAQMIANFLEWSQ